MKTLLIAICLISLHVYGQPYRSTGGQLNNRRTGPIGAGDQTDRAFWGTFLRARVVYDPQDTKFVKADITIRTQGGETKVYTLRDRNYITRNGYPATIEEARAGEFISGISVGETDIIKHLTVTTPTPPKGAKPKTNSVAASAASAPKAPDSKQ